MTPSRRLILDVDTGIDDSLALLYAVASPLAELVAVTTCAGNAEIADVTRNTATVLSLAGAGDVPLHAGAAEPLVRALKTAPETHGPRGLGYATVESDPEGLVVSDVDAAHVIVDLARREPGELTLVALAPLTNVARAVIMEPRLPSLLRQLVVMGGAFGTAGNATATAEWNVHVDPEACQLVFASWERAVGRGARPVRVVGLNVTERVRMVPEDFYELARRSGVVGLDGVSPRRLVGAPPEDPILAMVFAAVRFYFEFHDQFDGFYGAFTHDPFVVAATLDPSLIETRLTTVDVVIGGMADGQTIADFRSHWGRPLNGEVAMWGDASRFLAAFTDEVSRLVAARAGRAWLAR